MSFTNKYPTQYKILLFYYPSNWVLYAMENHSRRLICFKLYSGSYYYQFAIKTSHINLCIDSESSVIYFFFYKIGLHLGTYVKNVNQLILLLTTFIFFKIKFRGKGYYLYKSIRSTITPQFGYSHRIYLYNFFNIVKFLTKTKILIFGFSKKDVLYSAYNLKKKRSINIFTGRGVRFAKQIIYKKTGKVSMYR